MARIIEVQRLTHNFGNVRALDGLTFSVEEGEVFGVLGPNGAGKTTSVRLLNGVLAPASGKMQVMGFDPATQGCALRRHTGVLTETPSLYERLTARENLLTFGALYEVPQSALPRRVDDLLEQFELTQRANDRVGGFSKGMKQRLALARALLHDPQLLFLDEPTAGLDPQAALQVLQRIEQLSRQMGRTVFLCTHNLEEAQRLCDRVAVLNQGRLLALGTQADLAATLWRGQWVDFQFEAPLEPSAMDFVKQMPGITDLQNSENHLAVQVDRPGCIPDLVNGLVTHRARILQVQPRKHTLEHIYFELQNQSKGS